MSFLGLGMIVMSVFGDLFSELGEIFSGSPEVNGLLGEIAWDAVLTLVNYFVVLVSGILQIYVALSIGHLFRSKRVLWAVLIYFGIGFATSIVTLVIELISMSSGDMASMTSNMLYMNIPLNLGLGILYFFLSERILRTRLNLE